MAARTRRQKDEKAANAQQSTAIYVQSAPFSLHCIAANGRQQKINKSQVKNGATIKPKWHRTRPTNKQTNKQTDKQTDKRTNKKLQKIIMKKVQAIVRAERQRQQRLTGN